MKQYLVFCFFFVSCYSLWQKSPISEDLVFSYCDNWGWSCENKTDQITSVVYTCKKRSEPIEEPWTRYESSSASSYYQAKLSEKKEYIGDIFVQLDNWENISFEKLTISGCKKVTLLMHSRKRSSLKNLIIEDVQRLEILPALELAQKFHPRNVAFRNVRSIPKLYSGTFFDNGTAQVIFENVAIGLIDKGAINLTHPLDTFVWDTVTTYTMKEFGISVSMCWSATMLITKSTFPILRPRSIIVKGGQMIISSSNFEMLQDAAILSSVSSLNFLSNTISGKTGTIFVQTTDLTIENNSFMKFDQLNFIRLFSERSGQLPLQITFNFIKNKIRRYQEYGNQYYTDSEQKSITDCFSRVHFIQKRNNCYKKLNSTDLSILDTLQNDLSVVNYVMCDNQLQNGGSITIPRSWDPINQWQHVFCKP